MQINIRAEGRWRSKRVQPMSTVVVENASTLFLLKAEKTRPQHLYLTSLELCPYQARYDVFQVLRFCLSQPILNSSGRNASRQVRFCAPG